MNQEYDNTNRIVGWKRESKNGKTYLSLIINVDGTDYRGALFREEEKKSDKSPDYTGKVHVEDTPGETKKDTAAPVTDKDVDDEFSLEDIPIPF